MRHLPPAILHFCQECRPKRRVAVWRAFVFELGKLRVRDNRSTPAVEESDRINLLEFRRHAGNIPGLHHCDHILQQKKKGGGEHDERHQSVFNTEDTILIKYKNNTVFGPDLDLVARHKPKQAYIQTDRSTHMRAHTTYPVGMRVPH